MKPLYILLDRCELVCVGDTPGDLLELASLHETRLRRLGLVPRFRTLVQRGVHPGWLRTAPLEVSR